MSTYSWPYIKEILNVFWSKNLTEFGPITPFWKKQRQLHGSYSFLGKRSGAFDFLLNDGDEKVLQLNLFKGFDVKSRVG